MLRETSLPKQSRTWAAAPALWLALLAIAAVPVRADEQAASRPGRAVDFESEVYPIFERSCHACHGSTQQMGEFRLDARDIALSRGSSGPNIVAGEAGQSPLYQRIAGIGDLNAMPMTGERLSESEVRLVRLWIDQGAEWPENVGTGSQMVSRHWAYRPPERPAPPKVLGAGMVRNPIDSFALARLEEEGLSLNPPASKPALIRRVSLDLTGLPPTIEEVDRFLADARPDAYDRMVDRTLKSPHFGEHWARYWLDLARYADTNGYESDEPRTVWAYRDWVVDAFNRNLPFDRFTTEQLAGDLLPDPTTDQIVATGFHRNTMLNNEAGSKDDEFYDAAVKDRVDTTATVWLGSTIGCAQCHDHKYDPFRQSDYYQLYGIFNNTADSAIKVSEELEVFTGDRRELRRRAAEVDAARRVLDTSTGELENAQRAWEARTASVLRPWREAWQTLQPATATAGEDGDLAVLADGSVVPAGTDDGRTVYEVAFETPPATLSGIRIEALGGLSAADNATGSAKNGAFSVTAVEVERWTPEMLSAHGESLGNEPEWGNWHVIGPFRVRSRDEAYRNSFPPETLVDLAAVYEQGHLAWTQRKDWSDGVVHYLQYIPDGAEENCASYAFRTVDVREPMTVTLSLGSLKGLKVWLNSELALATDPTRSIAPDQELLSLDLRAGRNEILLKLTNDRGQYGFYFDSFFGQERDAQLAAERATADHGGWESLDLAAVLDGKADTAWSALPEDAAANPGPQATLRFSRPADMPAGSRLRVRIFQDPKSPLGPFRISATSLAPEELAALQQTPARVRAALGTPPGQRSANQRRRLAAFYRSIAPELAAERGRHAALRDSLDAFRREHTTKTLVMRELAEPREARIQRRGNFLDLGDRVEPGVPPALISGPPPAVGDRLALSRWLTDASNPLTARVRANQVWSRLFGRGLVTTPEDFGTQGDHPTHPALLDWLATEFVRLEWDTQALLKTILASAVYRQDSTSTPSKLEKDPLNSLLSRGARFRVGAEAVRDVALASSGLLSRAVGGPSVFPPQPAEVFGEHFFEGGFKDWPTSEGADRYRRGLYTFYKRTIVYPTFMNFDGPDRTVCTVNRSMSNTPLQALNTLNDPSFVEAAGSLAATMLSEGGAGSAGRLEHGFRAVLARRPQEGELRRLEGFLERMRKRYSAAPAEAADLVAMALPGQSEAALAPWVMVANVLLNLDETFTRE